MMITDKSMVVRSGLIATLVGLSGAIPVAAAAARIPVLSLGHPRAVPIAVDAEGPFADQVQIVHQQVNEFRRSQGLAPLILNSQLSAQAQLHSEQMAIDGRLSHDGFDDRIATIQQEWPLSAAAENVASNFGHDNPADRAMEGWKNSPGHRQNLLGDFTYTGIGIAQDDQGQYYFTQIFWQQ